MLRNALMATVLAAVVAAAHGDISTEFVMYQPEVIPGSDPLVPDFNDGSYWTIDVMVTVCNDDDWISTNASADVRGGFFFEHPLGGDTPPDPDLFDEYAALEWDSYYASTKEGSAPWFGGLTNGQMYRWAIWLDIPPNGGDGTFLVARYTVKETCPESFGIWLWGNHMTCNGGGEFNDFWWPWPPVGPPPTGDSDGDYCVDEADLLIILAAFGSTADDSQWDCRADIDADYDVDQSDLGLLLAHWGEGCP